MRQFYKSISTLFILPFCLFCEFAEAQQPSAQELIDQAVEDLVSLKISASEAKRRAAEIANNELFQYRECSDDGESTGDLEPVVPGPFPPIPAPDNTSSDLLINLEPVAPLVEPLPPVDTSGLEEILDSCFPKPGKHNRTIINIIETGFQEEREIEILFSHDQDINVILPDFLKGDKCFLGLRRKLTNENGDPVISMPDEIAAICLLLQF